MLTDYRSSRTTSWITPSFDPDIYGTIIDEGSSTESNSSLKALILTRTFFSYISTWNWNYLSENR